jgi:hypothetical protein
MFVDGVVVNKFETEQAQADPGINYGNKPSSRSLYKS